MRRTSNLANSKVVQKPLVWIDLEMTGLDLKKDTIIEIACIVTDGHLNLVDNGLSFVIHKDKTVMDDMNEWCTTHHGESGLTTRVLESTITTHEAESRILAYIKKHVPTMREGLLAGNSVHVDKTFLAKEMPSIVDYLHYRIVDVSSVTELGWRWRPHVMKLAPRKNSLHRALDDIRESIAELKWCRERLFK